jgi:hypothetical protein
MPINHLENDEWYCRLFGKDFGPLPLEILRQMVETEQLAADDLVRSPGSEGAWHSIRDTVELRTLLKGANASDRSPAETVDREPTSVQGSSAWYYRFDGKSHGPMTLDALREFVGSSGETASDVVVRQGEDSDWVPFLSLPGMSQSPGPASRRYADRAWTVAGVSGSPVGARGANRPRRQHVRDNRYLAISLAAWLLINAVILVGWPQSHQTERKYLATLRGLEAETKSLQTRNASPQEWSALRARTKRILGPIVQDLKTRASPSEPICQHLLWVVRDQFPGLVGPRTAEMKERERVYQAHMRVVEEELAQR